MNQVRYLLASEFGWSWNDFKDTPAHLIRTYINDIERAKRNFKGVSSKSVRQFASSMEKAGISLS
jgi:hypothetical protein